MEVRNVQRTGEMFYLYLPTRWCKRFNITGKSKVGVQPLPNGSLGVFPQSIEEKPIHLSFKVENEDVNSLHKLIIASYISPASSFKIELENGIDFAKVLAQKNLVSLELVEIDDNTITCESSIHLSDPLSLLTTMIRKVRNLLMIMPKKEHAELLERYEEEIDRSKLMVEKAVVSGFVNPVSIKVENIELHFISLLSKELERIVDHLITLKKPTEKFILQVGVVLKDLQSLLKENCATLEHKSVMPLLKKIEDMQDIQVKDVGTYSLRRIVRSLNSIAEVLVDWAVMKEVRK